MPTKFMTELLRKRQENPQAGKIQSHPEVNRKPEKPSPPPPLTEQVREVLAKLPHSLTVRVSAAAILPHLKGRYRPQAHLQKVGQALRTLGYTPERTWRGPDAGRRFWVKAPSEQGQRGHNL